MDERNVLLRDIAMLCIDINGIGDSNELENGKSTVFFELSGHVGAANVRIYECGWYEDSDPTYKFWLSEFTDVKDFHDCIEYLEMIKERL